MIAQFRSQKIVQISCKFRIILDDFQLDNDVIAVLNGF